MLIYPAIDLKAGRCVRLLYGDANQETFYSDNPVAMAQSFTNAGAQWLHIVDLDGAFSGKGENREIIESIVTNIAIPVQVGGGVRSTADIETLLGCGVKRVVIGTAAVERPEFVKRALARFGTDAIAVGLDARDGYIATKGWTETSKIEAVSFAKQMAKLGVLWTIYTDISRDGALVGPNLTATKILARESGLKVIASGGVASLDDIREIKNLEADGVVGVITGKALYEKKFTLAEALRFEV